MQEKHVPSHLVPSPRSIIASMVAFSVTKVAALVCSTLIILMTSYWWLGAILFILSLLQRIQTSEFVEADAIAAMSKISKSDSE